VLVCNLLREENAWNEKEPGRRKAVRAIFFWSRSWWKVVTSQLMMRRARKGTGSSSRTQIDCKRTLLEEPVVASTAAWRPAACNKSAASRRASHLRRKNFAFCDEGSVPTLRGSAVRTDPCLAATPQRAYGKQRGECYTKKSDEDGLAKDFVRNRTKCGGEDTTQARTMRFLGLVLRALPSCRWLGTDHHSTS
jgi:hypothetical protein